MDSSGRRKYGYIDDRRNLPYISQTWPARRDPHIEDAIREEAPANRHTAAVDRLIARLESPFAPSRASFIAPTEVHVPEQYDQYKYDWQDPLADPFADAELYSESVRGVLRKRRPEGY